MFDIKYLVSERDIIEWYKRSDNALYGYFWFVIDDKIIGDPPTENFPLDFLSENLIDWQRQMQDVAKLKKRESKKCYFCTPNRLNLVFRVINDLQMEILYLCDDKEVWTINTDRLSILAAIDKFNESFNNGIEFVVNNRI